MVSQNESLHRFMDEKNAVKVFDTVAGAANALIKGIEKYSNIEYKYGKDLIDNKENINYFKELQKRYENKNDEELEVIIKKLSHKD